VSAVFGVCYLDGRCSPPADLDRMALWLNHRGGDHKGTWFKGPAGLGHHLLKTTPESLTEEQPLFHQSSGLVLVADARIDNRGELLEALDVRHQASELSDAQLILSAYEKWGDGCVVRLIGDFAFAIWDTTRQEFFCARDRFGVKPFYYYVTDGVFAFASEMKALFALPEIPRRLNEDRIAEHLAGIFTDNESTFYRGVLRLPPARTLRVGRGRKLLLKYWSLDPTCELRLASDEEYAGAFREIFREAVRCRLRSAFPVGSMLSGGLDSSSITCLARELLGEGASSRLTTFSNVFDQVPQCDERRYIETVLAGNGFRSHYIHGDACGPLTHLERLHWHEDQPFFAPGLYLTWNLYAAARQQGVRILLDGHDGDTTVSHGYKYVDELAAGRRWLAVASEVRGLATNFETSPWRLLRGYAWHYGLSPMLGKFRLRSTSLGRLVARSSSAERKAATRPAWRALVRPEFIERTNLAERYDAWRRKQPSAARSEREGHYRGLTHALQPFALEVLDAAAAAHQIEPRYPFYDKRLVEFCLGLPPEQKMRRGWTRLVLRRAMGGILPPEIQWRGGKTDFLPSVARNLRTFDRARLDSIIFRDFHIIRDYVDVTALRRTYQRVTSPTAPDAIEDVMAVWQVASLASWLQGVVSLEKRG
jgi:asparagine synthase (glutamine-hydrolysing)